MAIDIGIETRARQTIAGALGQVLDDTYGLYLTTDGYHWNVEGPMFNTLHLMFETQYKGLWLSMDLIAERIRSLGAYAPVSRADRRQVAATGGQGRAGRHDDDHQAGRRQRAAREIGANRAQGGGRRWRPGVGRPDDATRRSV